MVRISGEETSPEHGVSVRSTFVSLVAFATLFLTTATAVGGESGGDEQVVDPEGEAVWAGVRELESSYRKTAWTRGLGDMITGGLYLGFGVYRLTLHRRRGIRTVGAFDFPWPGLNFTILGARGLGTGIYLAARTRGEHKRAAEVLEKPRSLAAGRMYLRHRADAGQRERVAGAIGSLASSVLGSVYVFALPNNAGRDRTTNIISGSATLALGVGMSVYRLLSPSLEERVWEKVRRTGGAPATE